MVTSRSGRFAGRIRR